MGVSTRAPSPGALLTAQQSLSLRCAPPPALEGQRILPPVLCRFMSSRGVNDPLLYTRVGKIANNRPASPFLNYRKLERIFDESGEDGID
jgi:hypothetical protein